MNQQPCASQLRPLQTECVQAALLPSPLPSCSHVHVQHSRTGFRTVVPCGGLPQSTGGPGRGVLVSQLTRCFLDVLHVLGGWGGGGSTGLRHLMKERHGALFQKRIICSDVSHSRSSKGAAGAFKPPSGETRHVQMFGRRIQDCFYCFKHPEEQFISIRPHADAHLLLSH